jgi:hypothetical protein
MDKGYIRLGRSFFSHKFWKEARTLSECEAWLDLIQSARYEATVTIECIAGREISYGRGQYPAAIRFLAKRWNWGEKKVRSFLHKLVAEKMVSIDNSQGISVLTLVNYEKFNVTYSKGTAKDTAKDTPNDLSSISLQEQGAQQMAQQKTQEGHGEGTKEKKDENKDEKKGENSPAHTCAYARDVFLPVEALRREFSENQLWVEGITMQHRQQHGLTPQGVRDYLSKFSAELALKGDGEKPRKDYQSHFISWLKIELEKNKRNGNTQQNTQQQAVVIPRGNRL